MASLKQFMANLNGHAARTDNPHGTTYAQVGAIQDAAGAVTDSHIGNRTINQATNPTSTGSLTTLFGGLANRIQAITGGAHWISAPPIDLYTVRDQIQLVTGEADAETPPKTSLLATKAHIDAAIATAPAHGITGWGTTAAALAASAFAGSATSVSRSDHQHPRPSAAEIGAMALSHPANSISGFGGSGVAASVARSDHNHSAAYAALNGSATDLFMASYVIANATSLSAAGAYRLYNNNGWFSGGAGATWMAVGVPTGGGLHVVRYNNSSTYHPVLASAFPVSSSRAGKKLLDSITAGAALQKTRALQAVRYQYLEEGEGDHIHAGYTAEDVAAVFPEAVYTTEGVNGQPMTGIDYGRLSVLALQSIQELVRRIEILEKRA